MKNLLNLRKDAGLTQGELAKQLGVCPNTISQYELGKRKPDIFKLSQMATILNCTVDDLIVGIKKETSSTTAKKSNSSQSDKVT